MSDIDTLAWKRNRSDDLAIANGCRFDAERGAYAVWWIERYCRLYEGDPWAGQGLVLHGCRQCQKIITLDTWDKSKPHYLKRAEQHCACVKAGHAIDWQFEGLMRLFGWIHYSEDWDRWVRRFRRGSFWVPKKSKKSPTLAAVSLYLLAGDGEPGNHVYLLAKDGTQAREIAGAHTIAMVDASEELSEIIKIDRSEGKLTHLATGSTLKPMSSGDTDSVKSKEGINGSTVTDETHVVDDKLMGRVARAGASRPEPLQLEFSTAGLDPDCYGRRSYEYGKRVECGAVESQSTFFLCFEAPQDLSDEDLADDPLKWGRMANPAWGNTIKPSEFLDDYNISKRSLADLAQFKTYRLNIWQQAASPWLRLEDWRACRADFTEDDMAGRGCCVGLDLAKTRDMTALALVFPMGDGRFRLLAYFFMPETGSRRIMDKIPEVRHWIKSGRLIITPGDVTDYGFVKKKCEELAEKFHLMQLLFDPWNAEHITQEISDALGVERVAFSQSMANLNEPTKEFERCVISSKLEHDGNPILDWQIGHVNVKTDANGNKRPVKPPSEDIKKIDGVVAAIMGMAGAMKQDEDANWYKPGRLRN